MIASLLRVARAAIIAVVITAFVHSLIVYLQHYRAGKETGFLLKPNHWWLEKENYFWASRFGLAANYIENSQGNTRPIKQVITDILDSLTTTAIQLGELEYLQLIREQVAEAELNRLQETPSYLRQRQIWQETGSQQAVVAFLVRQLKQELRGSLLPRSSYKSPSNIVIRQEKTSTLTRLNSAKKTLQSSI